MANIDISEEKIIEAIDEDLEGFYRKTSGFNRLAENIVNFMRRKEPCRYCGGEGGNYDGETGKDVFCADCEGKGFK